MQLDVHMEGLDAPVGTLSSDATSGAMAFQYTRVAQDRGVQISLSLPLREDPFSDYATRGFFANLLQEGTLLEDVLARHRLDRDDVVGILAHIGGDCPGAISCVPEGEGPAKHPGDLDQDYDPLPADRLEAIMASLRQYRRLPSGEGDPSPLAGVQGKISLSVLGDNSYGLPRQRDARPLNVPTTHILKVARHGEKVDQEFHLLELARETLDHPVAAARIVEVGAERGLLVTRYDRQISGAQVFRRHQEDFCQALGLMPSLKYQRNAAQDGPRYDAGAAAHVLSQTASPAAARLAFLEAAIFNLIIGNRDDHAKNFSLLYRPLSPDVVAADRLVGAPDMAPLYDLVATQLDPTLNAGFPLMMGAARHIDELDAGELSAFMTALGLPARRMRKRLERLVQRVVSRIDANRNAFDKAFRDMALQNADRLNACGLTIDVPEYDLSLPGGGPAFRIS